MSSSSFSRLAGLCLLLAGLAETGNAQVVRPSPATVTASDLLARAHTDDELFALDRAVRSAPFDPEVFFETFESRTIDAGGTRVHAVVGGSGPPLLITHGFPATWFEWRNVMPLLAERHTVIAVTLPGIGASGPAAAYDARSIGRAMVALLDTLGFASADILGHDIGAPVAYALAADYPSRVRRLIVMEFVMAGAGLEELRTQLAPALWHFDFMAAGAVAEQVTAGQEEYFVPLFFRPYAEAPEAITDEEIAVYIDAYSRPGSLYGSFGYYRSQATTAEITRSEWTREPLQMPVLAIASTESLGSPEMGDPSPAEASIRQLASSVRYEGVGRTGHWIAQERPVWVAERALRFFANP